MSEQEHGSGSLTPEGAARFREQAETLIRSRIESIARLESLRSQARDANAPAVEAFFFQVQQSDQRIIDQAEQLFGGFQGGSNIDAPARDHLVDDEVSESFPASDPPTYSRIT